MDGAEVKFFERIELLIGHPIRTGENLPRVIKSVCGVDAAYSSRGNHVTAASALINEGELAETSVYSGTFSFPYVSGLFFLHEGPFVVAAVEKLQETPQLVCFDAHGMAHPRHMGLATICGMVLHLPSIGVAKSHLIGKALPYHGGLLVIKHEGRNTGFVTSEPRRYWSSGNAVSEAELERIVSENRAACLKALQEAHKLARTSIS